MMLKNTQSGRSMIEMLGVLAIIGVLSAGGIAGYSMAMKNYKANKASEVVQMVSTQMKTVFNGVYPAGNTVINTANLGKVGITTDDSPFVMTIEGGAGGEGTESEAFKIVLNDVEKSACIKLATANWGSDIVSIKAGTTSKAKANLPFSIADANATTACSPATGEAAMEFVFK